MNITAMSFNLRISRWLDLHQSWPFRKGRAAEAILAQSPWIVGTQEADLSMLKDLDPLLKGYERIGEGRRGGVHGEHNAIYYSTKRLRLTEHGQFWMSETPGEPGSKGWDARFPRICTWGRFQLRKESGELLMYNTHLDHVGEKARINSVQLIWQTIQEHQSRFGPTPFLLSGDFNATPAHPAIRFLSGELELEGRQAELANAFADPAHAGRTFHGFLGGKSGEPIDYLFGGGGLQPLHGDVIRSKFGGRYPSDHYPVTAIFRFKPAVR
ncbi:endonuclease/exonuclease/phosphatase family protein [Gorillibacterium sp. sgz5001074]|uniref:endonuclease/exonuclease/phosphatase family protein n=1 Tax=Gorillibacterium sp. sgz5001074 TaxID=3446695 RepID=UPI003F67566A